MSGQWWRVKNTGRRDVTEPPIVKAFRDGDATVEFLGSPVDLLVGFLGETHLVEVKTSNEGLTEEQMRFRERWKGKPPVEVRTPAQARKWLRVWSEKRTDLADVLRGQAAALRADEDAP
jgi:hypothetical protein